MPVQNQVPEFLIKHFEMPHNVPIFLHPLFHPQTNDARKIALLRQENRFTYPDLPTSQSSEIAAKPESDILPTSMQANDDLLYNPIEIMESQGMREKILTDFKLLREKEMLFRIYGEKWFDFYNEGNFNCQDDSCLQKIVEKSFINRFGSNATYPHIFKDYLPLFNNIEGANIDHFESIKSLNNLTIELYDTLERLIPNIASIIEERINLTPNKNIFSKWMPKSTKQKRCDESFKYEHTLREIAVTLVNLKELDSLLGKTDIANEFFSCTRGQYEEYPKCQYNSMTCRFDFKRENGIGIYIFGTGINKSFTSPSKFIKKLYEDLNKVRIIEQEFIAFSAKYK